MSRGLRIAGLVALIFVGGLLLAFEIKLYGDAEYKRGCIWQLTMSGHADQVWRCPIYPDASRTGDANG